MLAHVMDDACGGMMRLVFCWMMCLIGALEGRGDERVWAGRGVAVSDGCERVVVAAQG